jgi:2-polyprenyl-3-methyl-5-hydroxy-6-metoxy-1,4-benzoquinol methylase
MSLPDEYFAGMRADVAALVPRQAARVLDVGCGFGALGRLLAQRGCVVHGIERNPEAARHLDGTYARYLIGDVERSAHALEGERYDCIVFADILEHLVDPWTALARYSELLAPGGSVVASIPNIRNIAILLELAVRGRWHYRDTGLLDRTHLRFFTRAEIQELFRSARLSIERMDANRDRFRPLVRIFVALPLLLVPDLGVCQFLVRARRDALRP